MRPWLLLLALSACDTRLVAAEYDRRCAADGECVLVAEGELCGACGPALTTAAISTSELTRYQRERDAISCPPRLGPLPPCAPPDETPAPPLVAACTEGQCTARAP